MAVEPGRLGLTTGEVAAMTGLSISTVRRMVDRKKLLTVRPGTWRYVDPDDVALWIRANDRRLPAAERARAARDREALHRIRGNSE